MNKYPNYMNSNIDWIGQIPDHWEQKTIKVILQERKEINKPIKTHEILSLTMDKGVIPYAEKGPGGNKSKEDITAYHLAYPGDIVLNSMNVIAGSVGLSQYFGAVSPVYYMLRPRKSEDDVEYFNTIFQSEAFQKSLIGLGNGILIKKSESSGKLNTIRMRIPMNKLNSEKIPYPPVDEQLAISRFIVQKNSQIDSLIRKIERKIELLKEQRTSLIEKCVTKGLDPNITMKDSRIKWVGKIPSHWEIKRIKHLGSFELSSVDRHVKEEEMKVNICHYPQVYYNEYITELTEMSNGTCSTQEFEKFRLNLGDILLTKDSESPEDIGIPTFVNYELENTVYGYHLGRIKINNDNCEPEFVYRFIESQTVRNYFTVNSNGITRFGLGKHVIENLIVLVPPKIEQRTIVEYIGKGSQVIQSTIEKEIKRIKLLKEYRQSLISNIVTGKFDIRNEVIQ